MNFITYATSVIKRTIPMQVLDLAFTKKANAFYTSSLDHEIQQKVLKEFFFIDLSLLHGVEIEVNSSDMIITPTSGDAYIMKLPKGISGGRSITTALSGTTNDMYPNYTTTTEQLYAQRAIDNVSAFKFDTTVKLDVIGPDEILVYGDTSSIDMMTFKFILNYSEDFNEIKPFNYPKLSKSIILAAKSVIYTSLIVFKGESYLYNGAEMPIIDSIIDKYEDAYEQYIEEQPTVKKILFMNDAKTMDRYVKTLVSNNS